VDGDFPISIFNTLSLNVVFFPRLGSPNTSQQGFVSPIPIPLYLIE